MEPESRLVNVINKESLPPETEIYLEKVEQLFPLIDKYVKVEMIKNYSYSGFLHAIDPVTKSTILSIPADGNYITTLIPGHAILRISETSSPICLQSPNRKHTPVISEEVLKTRKQDLLNWLRKNLLPAEERCDVIDIGNVSIIAPYTTKDICANNPVVAEQIKRILEGLPL